MNKQTREIQNLNRKAKKAGNNAVFAIHTQHGADPKNPKKHTVTVTKNDHSGFAFMDPAEALASKRQRGINSWRLKGKHAPNNSKND